jgi:2-(3-amino-3-carboxypropyl)histidine synthase
MIFADHRFGGESTAYYDLEVGRVLDEVRQRGAKVVVVQAPDGLKGELMGLYDALVGAGASPVISADPCYGGCDLAVSESAFVGADLIVHIGHERFDQAKGGAPVLYVEARHIPGLGGLGEKAAAYLSERGIRRVGLIASVQHKALLGDLGRVLEGRGVEVAVDRATGGLVLGCRVEAAKSLEGRVDAFLYLGGGDFHALGAAMAVEKEVFVADLYRNEVRDLRDLKRKTLAKRWWAIAEAVKARRFGVFMVAKSGQYQRATAERIGQGLESKGRAAYMLIANEINWERLAPFGFVEAFIVTGCPRIAIDNQDGFRRPVLNEEDAGELLKRL